MIRNTLWGTGRFKLKASELTSEEKLWLGSQNVYGKSSITNLHEQFGISTRTLEKYAHNVRHDIPLHEGGGRPMKLESSVLDGLKESVTAGRLSLRSDDFNEMLRNGVKETAEIRKQSLPKKGQLMHQKTYKKILNLLDVTDKNAEVGTDARIQGCTDVRSMVAFAARQHYFARLTGNSRSNSINADGTVYTVGTELKQTTKAIVPKKENGKLKSLKVAPKEGERCYGLNSIKGYTLIHSQGYHAPPILIVTNSAMPKVTMDLYKIPGMGLP